MRLWWRAAHVTDGQPASDTSRTFAPFFLRRLRRLSVKKGSPHLSALETRLVDRAMYSTYWDCVRVDAREEAQSILRNVLRRSNRPATDRRRTSPRHAW
jgi:hypothetical protein